MRPAMASAAPSEAQRVCPHQKDPLDELSPEQLLGLGQIRLNVLQGREPEAEGQLVVKRAELAAVVGAAGGRLQQQGAGS